MRLHLESSVTCRAREQRGTPTQSSAAPPLRKPSRSFLKEGFTPPYLGRYRRLIAAGWTQDIFWKSLQNRVRVRVTPLHHGLWKRPLEHRFSQQTHCCCCQFVIQSAGLGALELVEAGKFSNCQKKIWHLALSDDGAGRST
jgi:hypothetical protein